MIEVDGYKAFHGTLRVTPVNGNEPYNLTGDCLYKPQHDCWYVKRPGTWTQSIPADICEVVAEEVTQVVHGLWIDRTGPDDDLNVTDTCSVCLHTDTHSPTVDVPYCWHCGARMGNEEN